MPTLLLNKWFWIVIVIALGLSGLFGLLWMAHHAGGSDERVKQEDAIFKTNHKLKAKDAKIAKSVPVNGDSAAIDKFLLAHTGK